MQYLILLTFLILQQNHIIENYVDELHITGNNYMKIKDYANR